MPPIKRTFFALLSGVAIAGLAAPAQADGIRSDPLPRVEDRLCPGIIGLETQSAVTMVDRIRGNAEMFGLELADRQSCEANLVVAFVEDGQAYLADLADRRGYLFRDMDRPDREELLGETGPVRVWNQVAVRSRDGFRAGSRQNLTQLPQTLQWSAHSRIYVSHRQDITYSLVLFDRDATRGLTLAQLADYASLRALATEFPARAGTSEPSILTLFDNAQAAPESLTEFDSAWLAELYRGIPNIPEEIRLRGVNPEG